MEDLTQLLQGFQPLKAEEQATHQTPGERDDQRLEAYIEEVFGNRERVNQVLLAFLAVVGANGSVSFLMKAGLPALATGTVGGILIALALGNALNKLGMRNGRPCLTEDFFLGAAQLGIVSGGFWVATREQRLVEGAAKEGVELFRAEVEAYQGIKFDVPTLPLVAGGLLGLLVLATAGYQLLRRDRNGF